MKHIFIVNRISGKGSAYGLIDTIIDIANQRKLEYEIRITEYVSHASKIAKEYQGRNDVIIYSVGGDGTLLEVINGLDFNIPLGIIPAGSGNDFYRMIGGVPSDYRKIINDAIDGEIRMIDLGKSNRGYFLNGTSFGIDADINAEASHMIRKTFIAKGPAYVLSIIKNAIFLHRRKIIIDADGNKMKGTYYIVAVMNGQYYGNGVKASPSSQIDDGYLNLILFKNAPRYKAYPAMFRYLAGKAENDPIIERIKCQHLTIDSEEELSCQSDGENYTAFHLEIDVVPKALKLKYPQK